MMQKFIHSDIPSSIIENGCSKDSQNISDVSIRHLSSQQVTPEELDAWLRSTDVVLELTAQNDAVVTDSSKRRNEKIYPKVSVDESSSKSRRTRRRKFMNRRRSSLDDPGNRPVFGIEARALLEDNLITNSAADDEKGDHTNDKKNCTPKDELNHSRFGTPVVSNLSNRRQFVRRVGLSSTRLNSDRPRHGSSFDITALSSAYSPSNYHSMKKHDSHSDNSSQDMQPTKKRRVSFPADSDFDENGHVNVDSNFVAEQEPPRMIDRHEQFRRCQSDPEEYASSALHDSSNSIASHHFSRHFSFDSSARSNRISQISSSKFITSLDHSQETSDFIFKFESRRKPNHIVPLANMYSRLEANAKSRKSRKILMRIWKGSGNSAGAPQVSNGNITATDEKGCFRNDYSIGRDDSVMMMENYSYPPSSKRIHYHRDSNGDHTSRRVSNESFRELRNGFQSSYCHEGKTQDDFTRIDSNDRYICRENFLASG